MALDLAGNVASATSTGGITGKRGGRVRIVITNNTMLVVVIVIAIVKNSIFVTISFSWKVGDSPLAGSGGYADSR